MRARGRGPEPESAELALERDAAGRVSSATARPRRPSWTPVESSSAAACVSTRRRAPGARRGARGSTSSPPVREQPVDRVEEHHLLLDPERVGQSCSRRQTAQLGSGGSRLTTRRPARGSRRARRPRRRRRGRAAACAGGVGHRLGVPLDADHELALGHLDPLDHPVRRPRPRRAVRARARSPTGGGRS